MSTYIDSRTSSTPNTNSFLYQSHPPSSPVASNTHLGQQQQQQHSEHHHHYPQQQSQQQQQQQQQQLLPSQQQQQNLDDKSNDMPYNSDHGMLVDYLVSPKPSPSRALQPNLSDEMNNNSSNSNSNSNNEMAKRRSSSSSSSASSIALKPIKLATDISNSKEHLLKRDPFQLKSNSNTSSNANNASAAAATAPTSLAMPPKSAKQYMRKSSKLYKREKLKEAKNEYEEHIEEYFHQLTVGCQQIDCRNKFCASGRGKLYIKGNLSLL